MDFKERQLIKKYIDLVIQRWLFIAVSLLVTVTVGLAYYLYLPKVYKSSSIVSYEPGQINPAKMAPEDNRVKLGETLATLKELVTSRNSLEKVITQFSLYEKERKRLPIEDVIESMRKVIEIRSAKGDTFSVSFEGLDPQKVMKVTNALASLFIEENLKYREERATETSRYTQEELAMSKKVLDEKEELMRDYKLKYYNEMPEQRESNLTRLKALNDRSQGIQTSIQELERTKIMAQEQAALQQRLAAARAPIEPVSGVGVSSSKQPETDGERLLRLRGQVKELLVKYTEQHPEVRRTKQLIEQLEAQIGKAPPPSRPSGNTTPSRASLLEGIENQRLQMQLKGIDANIQKLRADLAAIPEEVAKYQGWIEAAPVREAEWKGLTRDYEQLRRNYDQLVAQNLNAQAAQNLEHSQKGSKFKIVDSARFPEKPFKPNFIKILLVAITAGLALSVGTIMGLDFIDTSFKDAAEIEEYIGIPVFCAIVYIENDAEIHKKRFWFYLSMSLVSICGAALLTVIVYLWIKGKIIV